MLIGKRGWFAAKEIYYPYAPRRARYARAKPAASIRKLSRSESGLRAGSQLQVAWMGRIAPQTKRLAAPWRRALPRHPVLQRRDIGSAVSRRDLERDLDKPGVDRRIRQLFGINHTRRAGLQRTRRFLG